MKKSAAGGKASIRQQSEPVILKDISLKEDERQTTKIGELDRVLGGGIVPGSLVLVGGDPGIGKSTLLLQVCRNLTENGSSVLYISGEESLRQIKLRANRIGTFNENLQLLCETNLDKVREVMERKKPDVAIIDSIQTMFDEEIGSAPGSVSQVRESTNVLMQIAKGLGITIFIVGHVTKEGNVAGPRVLEHMVDTVLYFEETGMLPTGSCVPSRTDLAPPMRLVFLKCGSPALRKYPILPSTFWRDARRMLPGVLWRVLWREPVQSLWKSRRWYVRAILAFQGGLQWAQILTA